MCCISTPYKSYISLLIPLVALLKRFEKLSSSKNVRQFLAKSPDFWLNCYKGHQYTTKHFSFIRASNTTTPIVPQRSLKGILRGLRRGKNAIYRQSFACIATCVPAKFDKSAEKSQSLARTAQNYSPSWSKQVPSSSFVCWICFSFSYYPSQPACWMVCVHVRQGGPQFKW